MDDDFEGGDDAGTAAGAGWDWSDAGAGAGVVVEAGLSWRGAAAGGEVAATIGGVGSDCCTGGGCGSSVAMSSMFSMRNEERCGNPRRASRSRGGGEALVGSRAMPRDSSKKMNVVRCGELIQNTEHENTHFMCGRRAWGGAWQADRWTPSRECTSPTARVPAARQREWWPRVNLASQQYLGQ